MDFSYTVDTHDEVPILRMRGAVDLASSRLVAESLAQLTGSPAERVVVDLGDVTFFDSAGLAALDTARISAERAGTRVILACGDHRILRLFQITGLDERFEIVPTVEQAAST